MPPPLGPQANDQAVHDKSALLKFLEVVWSCSGSTAQFLMSILRWLGVTGNSVFQGARVVYTFLDETLRGSPSWIVAPIALWSTEKRSL